MSAFIPAALLLGFASAPVIFVALRPALPPNGQCQQTEAAEPGSNDG